MPPTPQAITPEAIQAAANALVTATQNTAVQGGQTIQNNVNQLAPGLNTGQNAQGGFNYARNIAPVVDPLTTSLVSGAQQAIFKQTLKDAQFNANENYELAQMALRQRERAYREEQARRNRERRLAAERQAAAAAAAQIAALRSQQQIATNQPRAAVVARPSTTLTVQPLPQQKISSVGVANPGRIASVGVAQPGRITSVGVARPTQKITF